MAPVSPLAQLSQMYQGKATAAGEQAMGAYGQAFSQPKVGMKDAFMAGVIGLAPLIVAALSKGKKGLYAGAVGGLKGIESFDASLTEQQKQNQARSLAMGELASKQQNSYQDASMRTMEKDLTLDQELEGKRTIKREFGTGGSKIDVYVDKNMASPWSKAEDERVSVPLQLKNDLSAAKRDIAKIVAEEVIKGDKTLTKTLLDKDGNPDIDAVFSYVGKGLKGATFGSEEPYQRIRNRITGSKLLMQLIQSGKASPESEYSRLGGYMSGERLVPQSIVGLFDNLTDISTKLDDSYRFGVAYNLAAREAAIKGNRSGLDKLDAEATKRGASSGLFSMLQEMGAFKEQEASQGAKEGAPAKGSPTPVPAPEQQPTPPSKWTFSNKELHVGQILPITGKPGKFGRVTGQNPDGSPTYEEIN